MESSGCSLSELNDFSSENQSKTEIKRITQKEKDARAVDKLRECIPEVDDLFDIHGRIGHGTFSTVFLASLKCNNIWIKNQRKFYAIKHLIPTSHPARVEKELKCLLEIGGTANIAGVDLCLRRDESVAFVMPYLPHEHFQDYFDKLTPVEVQNYFKNLLIALKHVHSFNIIHRDIKPSNFLYSRKSGKFMLVDFGLAQNVEIQSKQVEKLDRKRKLSMDDILIENEVKRCKTVYSIEIDFNTNTQNFLTHYKSPLKLVNEIVTPKTSINGFKDISKKLESPLTRHVKSAILGACLSVRLQQRIIDSFDYQKDTNELSSSEQEKTKYNINKTNSSTSTTIKCYCYGKNQVCNICLVKKEIPATRAGTPGYRPPEVLLKYTEQTTAVDMWAVGVILISILSTVYPFFKASDDFIALGEIVTLFGDDAIRRAAFELKRRICMSHKCKPLDIRRLCIRLNKQNQINSNKIHKENDNSNNVICENCQQVSYQCLCADTKYKLEIIGEDKFPSSVYDLLEKLLEINPFNRLTAEEALNHPFFTENLV